MTLSRIITLLLYVAPVLFLVATALFGLKWWRSANRVLLTAWIITAGIFTLNGVACGQPPLGSMYHILVLLSVCLVPLYYFLARNPTLVRLAPPFAVLSALPLVGACFMERDLLWRRMPALQSAWFIPHVVSYLVAYAFAVIAFLCVAAAGVAVLRRQDPAPHEQAARAVIRLMLPFMTFGLCSGALWADAAWGAYWSWDPKETWSLVTWCLYVAILHVPRTPRGARVTNVIHALAFLALLVTFLLVNLLPRLSSALHSYA